MVRLLWGNDHPDTAGPEKFPSLFEEGIPARRL